MREKYSESVVETDNLKGELNNLKMKKLLSLRLLKDMHRQMNELSMIDSLDKQPEPVQTARGIPSSVTKRRPSFTFN